MLKLPPSELGLLGVGGIPCCGRAAEVGIHDCSKVAGPPPALRSNSDPSTFADLVTSVDAPWHSQLVHPSPISPGARTESTRDRSTARARDEELDGWVQQDVRAQLLSIEQKIDRLVSRLDHLIRTPSRTNFGGIPEELGAKLLCATPYCVDHKLKETLRIPFGDPSPLGSEKDQGNDAPMENSSRDSLQSDPNCTAAEEIIPVRLPQRKTSIRRAASTLSASSLGSHKHLHGFASSGRSLSKPMVSVLIFLEDPTSSRLAQVYAYVMPTLIILSVLVTLTQTIRPAPFSGMAAGITESCFDLIFTAEILVRFLVSPSRKAFLLSPFNLLDVFSSVPALTLRALHGFVIPIDEDTFSTAVLMLLVPVMRLLKTLRRFEKFTLVLTALALVFEALPVLVYAFMVLTLSVSSLIYLVEPRSNIESFPKAMWLCIVTMTTVGYGDVTPESPWGSVIVAVLVVCSVMYMAMPLGIIGHAFTQVWEDRDKILLMQHLREHLAAWGFAPTDMALIFKMFDKDRAGGLNLDGFAQLLSKMHLGLSEERTYKLFKVFDVQNTGLVNDGQFVEVLFPGTSFENPKNTISGADQVNLE